MNIDQLLEGVQKPGRYIGGEYNSVKKPWDKTGIKICLSYPDIYEVGMSYLGIKILYHLLNNQPGVLCERVFAPWPDMEKKLKESNAALFSLESRKPLKDFDIVGFSLGYELTYTNILNILYLGGIPLVSKDRKDSDPIVIAGGPSAFNPSPLSEFVDIFFIGEAEEMILEFLKIYKTVKAETSDRKKILEALNSIDCLYIPSLKENRRVKKCVVADLEKSFYPTTQIVPFIQIVHDRVAIEIMRGCPNRCRFCQARFLYNPLRLRSKEKILEYAKASVCETGYEEVSFLSLSSSNHPYLFDAMNSFSEHIAGKAVNLAVPSLRVDDSSSALPKLIAKNRKTGLTFAPESANAVMREKLGKEIQIEQLFETAKEAFKSGFRRIKLYFMIGFPFEKEGHLDEIIELVYKLSDIKKDIDGKGAFLTLSIANFIPKPHTPFQWLGIESREGLISKQNYLRKNIKKKNIKLDLQDVNISFLEAALSRGGHELSRVISDAWREGAKFDSWKDYFNIEAWDKAFSRAGSSLYDYAMKRYRLSDNLPWDFIDTGTPKSYLVEEAKKAGIEAP